MFASYLKTALRFLIKNKTFSLINIIGLAIGTLCCLYIVLYVKDQYSYDKHHKDAADIYRVTTALHLTGDNHIMSAASPPIAPAIKRDFPEVVQFTRVVPVSVFNPHKTLLTYKEKSIYDQDLAYVDSTFFDIFTYHFDQGQPAHSLDEPYSVVLLQPLAARLFGNEDPVGKVITMDNAFGKHDFKVTGVIDESLGKSHIHENLFITMNSGGLGEYVIKNTMWGGNNFVHSYIKIRPDASAETLEKKLPAFLTKYGEQQMKAMGMTKELHLQPVVTVHTTPGYEFDMSKTISPSFLYILLLIALLIQVIACINFMNLSTARASKRAKEVGVRKVVGASKADLVRQFLGESFLLAFLGVAIAVPLLALMMPYLNQITHSDTHLSLFGDYRLWLVLVFIIFLTGLVAGSYPAFYLSAFQAIKVIKGNFTSQISASGIRRSLVVFQFSLSIILIAGIIIIHSQLSFIAHKDLGFDKDQKLIFSFHTQDAQNKMTALADDLRSLSEVKTVSLSNNILGQRVPQDHGVYLEGGNMTTATDVQNMNTDERFVQANGIKIISGRDFRVHDSARVLINETLAKRLGLDPRKAPGTRLYTHYDPNPTFSVEIAGVMKDFNYNSLHDEVRPFMLVYDNDVTDFDDMTVSTNTNNYTELLAKIETIWHKNLPAVPFEYSFLDEEVQKQYEAEITLAQIIDSFTLMAIFISSLGLFGLAAFSAEQRNKEIGIRKVLGASVTGIVQLLSTDFLRLVIISFVIATPIAWFGMNKWLQAFTYRVSLSWWMFALAGVMALLIALVTVSFQAIKAAIANPIRSLRSE